MKIPAETSTEAEFMRNHAQPLGRKNSRKKIPQTPIIIERIAAVIRFRGAIHGVYPGPLCSATAMWEEFERQARRVEHRL